MRAEEDAARQRIIVILVATIAAITLLISANPWGIFDSFFSASMTGGIAFAFSVVVVARQRAGGLFGKTHIAVSIGLACWVAGQAIWAYETLTVGREPSDLSVADIPWLALYIPFGYYIYATYRYFGRAVSRHHLIIVAGIVAALTFNAMYSTFLAYESAMAHSAAQGKTNLLAAVVRSAYPVGDAVLVAPALLLLVTLRKGILTYTPWLFAASALVITAGADMLFTEMALLKLYDLSGLTYTLYNAGNLSFAGGLYWYNRFIIFSDKKIIEEFQRANR